MPAPSFTSPTHLLIGGQSVQGLGARLSVEDPATEREIVSLGLATPGQLDEAVSAARQAMSDSRWIGLTGNDRAELLHRLADQIEANAEILTQLLVAETGAPVTATRAFQVGGAVGYFRWYAEAARVDRTRCLQPRPGAAASASMVRLLPVGVVGAITAYNYPLLLAANKLGAALTAGCSVVLMPSPQAPLATLLLGELVRAAGYPDGVVNVLVGDASVAEGLTRHAGVDKVSFTGSTEIGYAIAEQAGAGGKESVLELGGKAACVLLPDADLETIVGPLLVRLFRNAGQGCQVPSRILVPRDQLSRFRKLAERAAEDVVVGDPWDSASVVGPVINAGHRNRVQRFIDEAVEGGGEILAQGALPDTDVGHWVVPTLIGGVGNDARIAREEIFGPVGVVLAYEDLDDAVRIANDSEFGLAAHVYGAATGPCLDVARRLVAGTVLINGVGLRPDAPSGGLRRSGHGREQGEEGIREYLVTQTITWAL